MARRRAQGWTGARAGLVAGLLLLSGCSGTGQDGSAGSERSGAPEPVATTGRPPYDPLPWVVADGPLSRCGPLPERVADQRFGTVTLREPGLARMPAVTAGRGPTVVVLLHQTDGNGLCGWLSFAQHLAHEPGVAVLAPDLCTYGAASCRPRYAFGHQTDQVRLAVDRAVRVMHARRVVLVGASMGGSLAVLTAARDHRVDAVVDLSGPDEWDGRVVHREAARLAVPALVAVARSEGADWVAAARRTVAAAPRGSELVVLGEGHGYELLEEQDGRPTAFSHEVRAWIRGS